MCQLTRQKFLLGTDYLILLGKQVPRRDNANHEPSFANTTGFTPYPKEFIETPEELA